MEKLVFAIDECPQKPQAQEQHPRRREGVSRYSLSHGYGIAVGCDQPYAPGLHRKRLAPHPLKDEVRARDQEKIPLIDKAYVGPRDLPLDQREKQCRKPNNCDK